MAEIERDGPDVLIRLKDEELEDLLSVIEAVSNSTARYSNNFPEGSLRKRLEQIRARAGWDWANGLGSCPPNGSNVFQVKVD
jgi:hypothetical protein